jgi:hypothetical protein
MFNDEGNGLVRIELRQGQGCAQGLTNVGHRQEGQEVGLIVKQQVRVRLKALHPVEAGIGDKPTGEDGQGAPSGSPMLPGAILGGLEFIPTEFTLGILIAVFDEKAMGLAPGHGLERRVERCLAEGEGQLLAAGCALGADEQPLLAWGVVDQRPDPTAGKLSRQPPPFTGAQGPGRPFQRGVSQEVSNRRALLLLVRFVIRRSLPYFLLFFQM